MGVHIVVMEHFYDIKLKKVVNFKKTRKNVKELLPGNQAIIRINNCIFGDL